MRPSHAHQQSGCCALLAKPLAPELAGDFPNEDAVVPEMRA